ncbi:MAG TPA: hypothetical protein VHZ54_18405 [Solirubrobacterales bacterium]|jgi:hypothetical protein|nr:hypothetical protein [Solirubrobacterales bacterium]
MPLNAGVPRPRISLGIGPLFLFASALGLVLVALGNRQALDAGANAEVLFWAGLVLILAPIAARLCGRSASRSERLVLAVGLGVALFLANVLHSPTEFTRFDEFGWWRATHELISVGHAFHSNPLNPAAAGYPGLATVTAAVSQLSGLGIFVSGVIVIGMARAILSLVLFLFLERIIGSPRAAGVGVLVYACNSSFLYFDAQFAYESIALALALAVLLVVERWSRMDLASPRGETLGVGVTFILLAAALTVTHHLTSIFVVCFLACWAALQGFVGRRDTKAWRHNGIVEPFLVLAMMIVLWLGFVAGHSTQAELGDFFSGAAHSIGDLVLGRSSSKQPFSGTGEATNSLERGLIVIYVLGVTAWIALGLATVWRRRVRDPLILALTVLAALWPLGLALRLTQASTEISGRAPEFVFFGVGALIAYVTSHPPPKPRRLRGSALVPIAFAALTIVIFTGGVVFGELKATRQPGPYVVGAEDRSVTPEGVAAARFAAAHLPEHRNILADRDNAMLLGAYGNLDPLFGSYAGTPISRVLLSPTFDRRDLQAARERELEYVLVDQRLHRSLPAIGFYVDSEEPAPQAPASRAALAKFGGLAGVSKIYTNGPIAVYDLSPLLR